MAKIIDETNNSIGDVSSLIKSELLQKYLALAFVDKKVLNSGNELFAYNGKNKSKLHKIELPLRK